MTQFAKLDTLLSVKNVGLYFEDSILKEEDGKPKKKHILSNVNFEIKDIVRPDVTTGQVVSLVGKSGVGKTQLIRMLSGLYIHGGHKTGEISVFKDKNNHELNPVKEGDMGIVFQDYYMPEHLKIRPMLIKSAAKNAEFKGDKKLINDAVDSYLANFELTEHKDKYPIQLSGGQKQRASIIMQIVNGSYFLLMDEPFSGLDPIMVDKTTALLQQVANSDELKTLIIVSHDLINCAAISDTIFVLSKNGREEDTGSSIVAEIDLLSMGLAYHTDIKKMPDFHNVIDEVKGFL